MTYPWYFKLLLESYLPNIKLVILLSFWIYPQRTKSSSTRYLNLIQSVERFSKKYLLPFRLATTPSSSFDLTMLNNSIPVFSITFDIDIRLFSLINRGNLFILSSINELYREK